MSVLEQASLFADVVQRLRHAAEQDRSFDAAQMQLINLAEIMQAAGPQWPQIKDRIRSGTMSFLKGCLADDDLVIPAGDGFLVIFAGADENFDAKARADELRDLLLAYYLGEDAMKKLGLKVAMRVVSPAEIGAIINAGSGAAACAEPAAHAFRFAPIWNPQAHVIAGYFCTPAFAELGGMRYGYDKAYVERGVNLRRDYGAVDLDMIDAVRAAINTCGPGEARPVIGLAVHSSTLQHRTTRHSYLEKLSALPPEMGKQIIIKIAEIDVGTPMLNLSEWAGMLRGRVRQIALEFHHSEAAPPKLFDIGAWGAGYLAPPAMNHPGPQMAAALQHMKAWGAALARQKARFFIGDLRRPVHLRLAADAGATFISSDAFWPYQQWPGGVVSAEAPLTAPAL